MTEIEPNRAYWEMRIRLAKQEIERKDVKIERPRAEIEQLKSEQKKAEGEIWMPRAEIRVLQELLKEWVELDNRGSAPGNLIDISRLMLGMKNG